MPIGYYISVFRGMPSSLVVLGDGIALRATKAGEWVEMDPGYSPISTEFDYLANSRYDKVVSEKEAARIAATFGVTLP